MQPPRRISRRRQPLDSSLLIAFRILFFLGILVGCYSLALNAKQPSYATQQKRTDQLYSEFGKGHGLIQSIQIDHAYLTTLVFYASRLTNHSPANITVRLRHPGATKDLAAGQFSLMDLNQQEMLTFSFPPLERSKNSLYEFVVETDAPTGSIGIWASAEDDYGEGTLVSEGKQLPFDLSFFTYYRTPILDTLNINNLYFFFNMIIMLIVYLGIGFILLLLFDFTRHENFLSALTTLFAMSIAFLPVLFALMGLASIKINTTNLIWAFISLMLFSALAFLYRWKFLGRKPLLPHLSLSGDWFFWSVNVLLAYALFARAAQVDGIYVPNWIDGLVHQRALDKILETGVQSASQIYHAGFYAHVLLTGILTGRPAPEAMLISGQLFSALGGISFLFLASRFFSSKFSLLLSAATYWFLAPFPSYLLTWSRFPFLLGLLLLPVLMAYSLDILRTAKWQLIFPVSLMFTGTLLIHYGVTVIFLVFLAVTLLFDTQSRAGLLSLFKTLKGWLLPILIALFLPATLFLGPKLSRFFFDSASRQALVELSKEAASQIDTLHILKLTAQNGGILMWVMAGAGLLFTLVHARKTAFLLLAWYAMLWAATWVQIQIWGIAISSYANLIIAASIPLSIFAGFSIEALFSPTPHFMQLFEKIRIKPSSLAFISLVIIVFAGSYSQLGTVNPISVLFTARDVLAAQWLKENVPTAAPILIDSFRWGETYWPSDGGGWLKPLTGRKFVYARSADEIADIDALIASQHIQFIYLGQGYGELSESHFSTNPTYQLLYHAQGVSIFSVKSNTKN